MEEKQQLAMDVFAPTFLRRLCDEKVSNVLMVGCGGGFDFVHSLVLYPLLRRLGKKVVIGSNSFGDVDAITHFDELVMEAPAVKRVSATSQGSSHYRPEISIAQFLDQQ